MSVYLVRDRETHYICGIVWGNLDEIWDTVDEFADPSCFEFARLPNGAGLIHIDGKEAKQTDDCDEEDLEEWEFSFSDFEMSELLLERIADHSRSRWRAFDYSGEGHGLVRRIFDRVNAERSAAGLPPFQEE